MVFTLAGDSTMMRSFVIMGQAIATPGGDGKGRGGEKGHSDVAIKCVFLYETISTSKSIDKETQNLWRAYGLFGSCSGTV